MSCIPSTYNASGGLVGCTEQELNQIISTQLYTVFALGAGLYLYKTFTAENWVDIAVQIGWGCVSAFTHAKRFTVRYVIPGIHVTGSFVAGRIASLIPCDTESEVSVEDDHCYVRVVKDGAELHEYSSIFGLIQHLTEQMDATNQEEQEQGQGQDSDDVVEVLDEDEVNPNQAAQDPTQDPAQDPVPDSESKSESESESHDDHDPDDKEDIKEHLSRIDNHMMQFDFVMCQVPTLQSATSPTPQVMHVVKYDGFPRESDGSYFYDRKFVPVNHRMMEIVLQHGDSEYELDLSSPDNFYVMGNKLLDPAFLKWFMRKNHNIDLNIKVGDVDATTSDALYTLKCIDNNAVLHTLFPYNCIRVSDTGFEVHDSRLI
jgi:hypothetical protein